GWLAITVAIGTRTRSLLSIARWNAGVSVKRNRTYKPKNTSSALARNGTRQPQDNNCASSRLVVSHRKVPDEHRKPTGAPNCGNIPYNAFLPGGAFSVASITAPPHSPPRPRPCPNRNNARSAGARTPMEE